jgi:hypothetical protein
MTYIMSSKFFDLETINDTSEYFVAKIEKVA